MSASRGRGTNTYETVLAQLSFKSGKHYWEITIDVYGTEEDIFIGICKPEIKYNLHGCETPGTSWGWQCTSARKMWPTHDNRT